MLELSGEHSLTGPRQVYAQISFPAEGGRQISVAWTYEDEEGGEHVYQRGYQGAFTSFRDLFLLEVRLPSRARALQAPSDCPPIRRRTSTPRRRACTSAAAGACGTSGMGARPC